MAKKSLAEKMAENSKALYEGMKTNTIGSFSSTEIIKKNIIILDELRDLIPPLLESEYESLKDNLQKHGCKDPLKIWQTTNKVINRSEDAFEPVYVLIDGHNRYKLCSELQIPFNIQIDNFESLKEVRDFMIDFQLSRRNITPQQASYLRGLRYNTEKKEVAENLKSESISPNGQNVHLADSPTNTENEVVVFEKNSPNGQNVHLADSSTNTENEVVVFEKKSPNGQNVHLDKKSNKTTAQELGEYFNVDEKTIRRDAEFAKGLEKLSVELRKDILNGKVKIEKSKIQKIGKINTIQAPLTSVEEISNVYNTTMVDTKSSDVISEEQHLSSLKFASLNVRLQKIYTAKKVKISDIEALKDAFEAFVSSIKI